MKRSCCCCTRTRGMPSQERRITSMNIKRCLLVSLLACSCSAQLRASDARPEVAKPHPITIAEILALRKPSEAHISPDGAQVAYVVTQAIRETNQDHAVLYIADAARPGPGRA